MEYQESICTTNLNAHTSSHNCCMNASKVADQSLKKLASRILQSEFELKDVEI